ncbi:metallophosphoesterase [Streptomyces sp. HPF1205]|uniref:metallophosphoesterase n=1 Tax=Streptomyces sp. HPF1205 TaxID=2873262 RepID=UPI001CEC998B|nr:metallophosphoesterase [Streptomyces sp. HPF1205]
MTQGAGQGYEPGSGYQPAPGYGYRAGHDAASYENDPAAYEQEPYPASRATYEESPAPYEDNRVPYDGPGGRPYDAPPPAYGGGPAYDASAPAPPAYEPTRPDAPLVPPEYTPTAHDLPVITADTEKGSGPGPLYVVGDVHGYLAELLAALRENGLVDEEGHWSAGSARLWFLGDFTDRGPDGIGVIELVMQLSAEAAAAGGYCRALMGNHELLLLGAHRFGDTPVNSTGGTASFLAAWRLNGGQPSDMERLEDRHLTWISRLDAAHVTDGHLLLHSDTTAYLDYGSSIEEMNDAVTGVLQRGDADECWDLFRKFTKRFAFRGDGGPQAARELLSTYGGSRVVHGHSPIPYLLGEVGGESPADAEEPHPINGPMVYAENLAVAMDGGVTMDGRLLVAQLPLVP